jgi:uncharacterized membrane-anchored protein YjiN (DUF445 family)
LGLAVERRQSSLLSKDISDQRDRFAALALGASGDLRRMKRIATGLLIAMALVFLVARAFVHLHPVFGFVKAFAEAAMVGGLADWFAVTALFRHPLGIPIPHTAIIPRNKDRIGDALAQFLRQNFLTPSVVARRMRGVDVAGAVGRFLADPNHGGTGRLRDGGSRLLAGLLDSLDDQRLGNMAKGAITDRLRALDAAPLTGQALAAAMKEGRHVPLLTGLLTRAGTLIEDNEPLIRDMVHERSNTLLRWTGLDSNVADAIITALNKLFHDLSADPDHPLRLRVDDMLADLADRLQSDPDMKDRVAKFKADMIENPALQEWIAGLWDQGRSALLAAARNPDRAMAGKLGDALRQLGQTVQKDGGIKHTINRFARRSAVGAAAGYGDSIVKLVSETVRSWDAQKVTNSIENAVGRDLQYIRVNGTLVGGLVGLALHTLDTLL